MMTNSWRRRFKLTRPDAFKYSSRAASNHLLTKRTTNEDKTSNRRYVSAGMKSIISASSCEDGRKLDNIRHVYTVKHLM
jgi:ribosomal protein L35